MQSKARNVTDYIQEAPEDRREALRKLRKLCLETLKGYEESMDYGGPGYKKDGVVEVGFASQKHFIGLYILKKDVLDAYRDRLTGLSVGKGCIRYPRPEKIDFKLVKQLLIGTHRSRGNIC